MMLRARLAFLWLGICGFFWPDATAEKIADATVESLARKTMDDARL